MQRVRMRTILATPEHSAQPGQEIDLPDDVAQGLVDGGYAERVAATVVRPAPATDAETADAPAATETTAHTRSYGRFRRGGKR